MVLQSTHNVEMMMHHREDPNCRIIPNSKSAKVIDRPVILLGLKISAKIDFLKIDIFLFICQITSASCFILQFVRRNDSVFMVL